MVFPLFVKLKSYLLPAYLFGGTEGRKQGSSDDWTVILVIRELENSLHSTKVGKEWPYVHLIITTNLFSVYYWYVPMPDSLSCL